MKENLRIGERLFALAREKGILIATHRGVHGGSIVENTIPAFKAALAMGTDIIEVDVPHTLDNKLVCIHDGMEPRLFRHFRLYTPLVPWWMLKHARYQNQCRHPLRQGVNLFDDFLEAFKDKCIINVDRCWNHWDLVMEAVLRHKMEDQVLFKCIPSDKRLRTLDGTPFMYMPILKEIGHIDRAKKYNLNIVAYEFVFGNPDSNLVDPKLMKSLKAEGCLLWGNAIDISGDGNLSGGLDDTISLTDHPDKGWGKLVDMGFDIIQTDFPQSLNRYLIGRNLRKNTSE
jgi:glycerophosphoryl diester phosphodiesterase